MEKISSVTQVNMYIKNMFIREYVLRNIYVEGEVSNCKYHSSGHIYFTIKDKNSQLSCVMFASSRKGLGFKMEEGHNVVVHGSLSVYERDGKYQLYAQSIVKAGAGKLYEEYDKMKKRLLAEGLFDDSRKKSIPKYVQKIGVVTSPTGAVIQDICNVSHRRNPYVQIYLYPARVQGEGAEYTIIDGIKYFEATDVDTIIIARGGGSIEDLWAFNEEVIARAIADCTKPVISAVGHETDTTIADFAADLRAPTPSAAAELAVYSYRETELALREAAYTMQACIKNMIQMDKLRLQHYTSIIQHASPQDIIRQKHLYIVECQDKLSKLMEQKILNLKYRCKLYAKEIKGLSPTLKLKGGYAYISDEKGNNINSIEHLDKGQDIILTMQDGYVEVEVKRIYKNNWRED